MTADINLDEIERAAKYAQDESRRLCHDDCPPECADYVSIPIESHKLLALVRAVRAAMEEGKARHDLLRFQHPPYDDCYRDRARAADDHAVKQRNMDTALAPFRKEEA